ncbi:MAG: polysaccharide pyruvyl transferase family protein [Candidatus Parabeggiatoa sp.]|nr:polysaccharide pyruvyl transferase family protein [Candidatus Parabeggiatoa sp.]
MRKEFFLLENIIKHTCGNDKVYYLPNSGNWGDALIRYGTLKFLRSVGIQHTELKSFHDAAELIETESVLIFGGGNWHNEGAIQILRNIHQYFHAIIVLPSTYEERYSLANTVFFSRDLHDSKVHMRDAPFCHDMAFYIDPIPSVKKSTTGYFFRTDKGSSGNLEIPAENSDISLKGSHLSSVYPFIDSISQYGIIHTDRLHVTIAGCLLGQEVHLYPNSYFKNKAVYLSSIEGYYDNVFFHETNVNQSNKGSVL